MTRIMYSQPPEPPQGKRWCLLCLMNVKRDICDAHPHITAPEAAKELTGDGHDDKAKWIPFAHPERLFEAVADGISTEIPQLGIVPLCFTHLAFFRPKPASSLALPGQQEIPPGLIRGTG